MNVLENWIENILSEPIDVLNTNYLEEDSAREELDSLPLPLSERGYTVEASYVSDYVLNRLHTKIRDEPCEEAIWDTMVWFLAHPLPFEIANDLVERGISTVAMAHTRQVDEIQWRLATIHEDALYTLITERYQLAEYSLDQFRTMLQMYVWRDDCILYILSYRIASSPEKETIYLEAVKDFNERQREKKSILSNILYALDSKFPDLQLNMGFRYPPSILARLRDVQNRATD